MEKLGNHNPMNDVEGYDLQEEMDNAETRHRTEYPLENPEVRALFDAKLTSPDSEDIVIPPELEEAFEEYKNEMTGDSGETE